MHLRILHHQSQFQSNLTSFSFFWSFSAPSSARSFFSHSPLPQHGQKCCVARQGLLARREDDSRHLRPIRLSVVPFNVATKQVSFEYSASIGRRQHLHCMQHNCAAYAAPNDACRPRKETHAVHICKVINAIRHICCTSRNISWNLGWYP
ncbi:hypothetical protein LIPSTDRAFT_202150 [Lipomyces starkeyi NRRL Y-11557]|uniref:Uncharacterized protein n=1 Tax=Lipomyces starkeyi NRRL Y-11557 TaxID=675824 RepID=A0A1E3PUT3_LIPST|nr:hypothetical protein LIPSTDRAFT_202150 [Lipomyces starkeyi NRRL Y-11557]